MSSQGIGDIERYTRAHGDIGLGIDAAFANRVLLALELLEQQRGLDPALAELRDAIKVALIPKSSGDTDSAPSTE